MRYDRRSTAGNPCKMADLRHLFLNLITLLVRARQPFSDDFLLMILQVTYYTYYTNGKQRAIKKGIRKIPSISCLMTVETVECTRYYWALLTLIDIDGCPNIT